MLAEIAEGVRLVATLDLRLWEIVALSLQVSLSAVVLATVLGLPVGAAVYALFHVVLAPPLVALAPRATLAIEELPAAAASALLVGSEADGLSASALAAADVAVRIPMAPSVDSLNVSTAAAVALHRLAPPPASPCAS